MSRGGRQHVLGVESDNGLSDSLRYSTRLPGHLWRVPETIDAGSDADSIAVPSLAAGRDDDVYAAWSQLHEGYWQIRFAVRANQGSEWSPSEAISTKGAADAWAPAVAVDGAGRVYVLWQSRAKCGPVRAATDILLRLRTAAGEWQPVERVNVVPTLASTQLLRLMLDEADNAFVEWQESGPGGTHNYIASRVGTGPSPGVWQVIAE